MDNKQRITAMKAGILHTTMTRDVSESKPVGEAESKGYRWIANSGETMPGMFGGIRLDIESMRLDRFVKNPIILYSHDGEKPIGIGDASKNESMLFMDVFFDEVDELSQRVKAKVDAGTLRAMSVGIGLGDNEDDIILDDDDVITIMNSELLEASICSVPRDAKALRQYSFITAPADEPVADKNIPAKTDDTETPTDASEGEEKSTDSDSESTDEMGTLADNDDGGDTSINASAVAELAMAAIETENKLLIEANKKLTEQVDILSEGMKFNPLEKNSLEGLHGLELAKAAFAQQGK